MKQCAHCGWETSNPEKKTFVVRDDFEIKVYLCPKCLDSYNDGTVNKNKSFVW